MAAKKQSSRKPPWKRAAPATARHRKLTPRRKSAAKARARRAGRPYPNLVDNMRAASKKPKRKRKTRKSRS
jgi:hypothetical protein